MPTSSRKSKPTGLLHHIRDWLFLSDLDSGFIFPDHIAITSLRPDLIVFSNSMKRIIIIALTCPCEENMECWYSIKLSKYLPLVDVIRRSGWSVDLFAIEVDARGYCSSPSLFEETRIYEQGSLKSPPVPTSLKRQSSTTVNLTEMFHHPNMSA